MEISGKKDFWKNWNYGILEKMGIFGKMGILE